MCEPPISKLLELVKFHGRLHKFQFFSISAAIFYENVISHNIWPRVHGQLCWFLNKKAWLWASLVDSKDDQQPPTTRECDVKMATRLNCHMHQCSPATIVKSHTPPPPPKSPLARRDKKNA